MTTTRRRAASGRPLEHARGPGRSGRPGPAARPPAGVAVGCSGAVRTYGAARAVDGLDLRVERGETVAPPGRNGAGKSAVLVLVAWMAAFGSYAVRAYRRAAREV